MIQVLPTMAMVEVFGGVSGWIHAIRIDGASGGRHSVSYLVRWWSDRELREDWYSDAELTPLPDTGPLTMGFRVQDN